MPNKDDPLNPFMEPFFARIADAPEGYITQCLGTGGCLLDLSLCNMPSPAFNPIHNETGGEDDALFHHLKNQPLVRCFGGTAFNKNSMVQVPQRARVRNVELAHSDR